MDDPALAAHRAGRHEFSKALSAPRRAPFVAVLFMLVSALAACDSSVIPVPSSPPDPLVTAAMDRRLQIGLRADRGWVEFVLTSPDSVEWEDLLVTPEEFAGLEERQLRDSMRLRDGVGLPADEDTVKLLLADPATVWRLGSIPMSPLEAAEWDRRVDNQSDAIPAITAYGNKHADDWAGLFFKADGTAVAQFSDDIEAHRAGVAALFMPETVRFEVRKVRWSLAELEEINERIDGSWFAERDITFLSGGPRIRENAVIIDVATAKPRPGIEKQIADHLGGDDRLIVRAVVRPRWTGPVGSVKLRIVDADGAPLSGIDCEFLPLNKEIELPDWAYLTSDDNGECSLEDIPATVYRVHVWQDFQFRLLATRDVAVLGDDEVTLTIPVFGASG